MPDAIFTDLRLAAVYDTLNPPDASDAFYIELAEKGPLRILDVGCGTGRFAVKLAALGHRLTGIDPADGMLSVARNRPGNGSVTWVQSDAASLDLTERFDLIIMTGHVFQVFVTKQDALDALTALRRHLAPGGRVAFETRNPGVREWENWVPEKWQETVDVPGVGQVTAFNSIVKVDLPLVTFNTHFEFSTGDARIEPSTLRFMPLDEVREVILKAGFKGTAWYGDWDRSPLTDESPEIIAVATL